MRNWNKKQHLPLRSPEEFLDACFAAGNSSQQRGVVRADAELE